MNASRRHQRGIVAVAVAIGLLGLLAMVGFALDSGHLGALRRLAPTQRDADKVRLLRSYDPDAGDDLDVPDPYYGGADGFDACLEMVEAASTGLLAAVREQVEGRAA